MQYTLEELEKALKVAVKDKYKDILNSESWGACFSSIGEEIRMEERLIKEQIDEWIKRGKSRRND